MAFEVFRAGEKSRFAGAGRRNLFSPRKVLVNIGNGVVAFCRSGDFERAGIRQEALKRAGLEIFRLQSLLPKNCPEMQEIASRKGVWETIKATSASFKNTSAKIEKISFFGAKSPTSEISAVGLDRAGLFEKFTWLNPHLLELIGPLKDVMNRVRAYDKASWFPAEMLERALRELSDTNPVVVAGPGSQFQAYGDRPITLKDVIFVLKNIVKWDHKGIIDIAMSVDKMSGEPYKETVGIFISLSKNLKDRPEQKTIIIPLNLQSIDSHVEEFD